MRVLTAPARYVQGPGVLAEPASYDTLSATRAFILGGETALSTVEVALDSGLDGAGSTVVDVERGVEACTFAVIESLSERAQNANADLVVGVGGGVALDVAKAVAERTDAELTIVPTVASTDAPCSAVSVVYDDAGGFEGYVHRHRNPEQVIVDTAIVADAPTRFLRDGMGDAFATRFEVEAAVRRGANTHAGGLPTDAAVTMARRCFENIESDGPAALAAVDRDAVTPAVERIVETNILLSGIGFESGGLTAAHAFAKGFSRAGVSAPHGLLVAFGTVAQLVLEDTDAETLRRAISVARTVGIDASLADLGGEDVVDDVAVEACRDDTTMSNQPGTVTPQTAADALVTADELLSDG